MATLCKLCNWELPAGNAQFCDMECECAFLHMQCIRQTVSVPVGSSSVSPSAGSENTSADQQQQYEDYLQLLTQLREQQQQQQQQHGDEENDGRVSPSLVDAVRDAAFRTHPWYYYYTGGGDGAVKGQAVVASVLLPMGTVLPLPIMASHQLLRCGAIDLPSSSTFPSATLPSSSSSSSSMVALVASLRELLECPLRRGSDGGLLFANSNGWMGMGSGKVKSLCTPSQWSTLFTAAATVVHTSLRHSSSTPAEVIAKQGNRETHPAELIQKLVQTFLLMRCSAARMKRRRTIGAEVGGGDMDWVLSPSMAEIAHSCQAKAVLEECEERRETSEEGQEMGASSTVISSSFRLRLMAPHRRYEAFTINKLLPFSALLWDTSRRQQCIVQQTGAICECARCVDEKEDLCRGFPCPLAPCQGTIFRKNETASHSPALSLKVPSLADEPAWRCHRCHATWSDRDMSSRLSQEKDIVDRLEALRAQSRFHERNVFESLTEIANRCSHTLGDAHWASIAVCEVLLSFYSFLIGTRRFANETMEVAQQMLLRWLLRWAKLTRKLAYWRHCPAYVMQQLSFFSQLLRLPSCAFDVKKLTAFVAAEIERGSPATSVDWLAQQPDESVTTLLTAWSDYLLKRMEEALNSARPEQAHPLLQRMMRGGGGSL